MNNWNRIGKPIVVLSLICVIVTGALAATNEVTAPIIEEATIAADMAAVDTKRRPSPRRTPPVPRFSPRLTASPK